MAASASLHITAPPFITLSAPNNRLTTNFRPFYHPNLLHVRHSSSSSSSSIICSYKVTVEHDGQTTELQVEADETILEKALDKGMSVPHDCKLGVCMTCPAKLMSGSVNQSEGMLSDDVIERGYSLLCVSYPISDCVIKIIPEEELLSLQLATADD